MSNTHLPTLLSVWEEAAKRGEKLSPNQLAPNQPDLWPQLERAIAALAVLNSFARNSALTTDLATKGTGARAVPPEFELLEELGRGGMGVVYKARQIAFNRIVALKMILGTGGAARFLAEAEAVAASAHPNVVQVYQFGEHNGHPFLVMEFLPGGTLSKKLRAGPMPARAAAELVHQLAGAVHAAHARDIVHRDVKPCNVLFDEKGKPKVTDFGLALRESRERLAHEGELPVAPQTMEQTTPADERLTVPGQVLGTPGYMAPEQAKRMYGEEHYAGPPADVWALGVILYQSLTGQMPFRGSDLLDVLKQTVEAAPVPPRAVVPAVPRDLELICLKCLQKDPADRYRTGQDLADDLDNFLARRPVSVRPAGPVRKLALWVRRNKIATATLVTVSALAVAASWFAVSYQAVAADLVTEVGLKEQEANRAKEAEKSAKDSEQQSKESEKKANQETDRANGLTTVARTNEAKAKAESARADAEAGAARWRAYTSDMNQIGRLIEKGDPDAVRVLLDRNKPERVNGHDLRGPEWYLADRWVRGNVIVQARGGIHLMADAPKRDAFAVCGNFEGLRVTQPDGRILWRKPLPPRFSPEAMALPAKDRAVVADQTGQVATFGPSEGTPTTVLRLDGTKDTDQFATVRVSPDGRFVAALVKVARPAKAGGKDDPFALPPVEFRVWEAASGKLAFSVPPGKGADGAVPEPKVIAFDPASKAVAVVGQAKAVAFDTKTWKVVKRFTGGKEFLYTAALGPNLRWIVTGGSNGEVGFWPSDAAERPVVVQGHRRIVAAVEFSPDGRYVATSGDDQVIRLWQVDQLADLPVVETELTGHGTPVFAIRWQPGGIIRSLEAQGDVRTWTVVVPDDDDRRDHLRRIAFAPNGTTLYAGDVLDELVAIDQQKGGRDRWRAPAPKKKRKLDDIEFIENVTVSPDGQAVVTAAGKTGLRVWNVPKRQIETKIPFAGWDVRDAKYLLPGSVLIVAEKAGTEIARDRPVKVVVVDTATRQEVWSVPDLKGLHPRIGVSGNGAKLAASTSQGLSVYDWATRQLELRLTPRNQFSLELDGEIHLSANGDRLFIVSRFEVTVYDIRQKKYLTALTENAKAAPAFETRPQAIASALSASSNRLAVLKSDSTLDLYHATTGDRLLTLRVPVAGRPMEGAVAWHPSGDRVVVCVEGELVSFDARPLPPAQK